MNRDDEYQINHRTIATSSAQDGNQDEKHKGFAYQRSPTGSGGIPRPTRFGRSDSQDKMAAAAGSGVPPQGNTSQAEQAYAERGKPGGSRPPPGSMISVTQMAFPADNSMAIDNSMPVIEDMTPRQLHIRDKYDAEESLLHTSPLASEKKSLKNSILSDDEIISTFEPAKGVTQSARKKVAMRPSIAAISTTAQKDNVKVVIRVRPVNEREKQGGPVDKVKLCLFVENNAKITLDRGMDQKNFTFDFVATQESEQCELFDKIAKPIADSCLLGYNGTIFAYGQTGSGKTFTIQGPTMLINGDETLIGASGTSESMNEKRGLMQRSFEYMFACMDNQKMEAQKQGIEVQFLVKSSYLEIYNEQIMDLLDPQSFNLHVREDIKKGVYVESLLEETVSNVRDMMNLTTRGARNRHVGSTSMNKESSRSHSVLTTTIESKTMNDEGVWQMKSSRFHIIDLAGSERSKATNAVGERLKEAGMINKSLTALGIVINSLVEISEGKNRHVHYRDSKLTFLLRDSLGGNSKTVIIANVTAAAISVGETLSTLKFAQRAKLIKNKAVINEESSATVHMLKQELRRVKRDLAEQTNLLAIANEQLIAMADRFPEEKSELEIDGNAICSVCKNVASPGGDENDVGLHFQDTSGLYHSHRSVQDEDSMILGEINIDKTPGGTSIVQTMQQSNPKAFKLYKQRAIELSQMKDRVSKVEKLLAENLENMDIQQKQHESQIDTLTKSNKDKTTALEASEKNRARDKMIIKFREERIAELESKLAQATSSETATDDTSATGGQCEECPILKKQLEDAQQEISMWMEVSDKNPKAAKLFAEKEDLLAAKKQLQSELKVTPESLTARIRGLNELTNNLNAYLKEYCMDEGFDNLKKQLESSNQDLTTKVEGLETTLSEIQGQHQTKLTSQTEFYEAAIQALHEKLEQAKAQFESEKVKIEQGAQDQMTRLKADLDASLAEKGELQKEIFDKVEAHEKQVQLQKNIDQLSSSLAELRSEKEQLESQVKKEQEEVQRVTELQRQAESQSEESIIQLQDQIEAMKEQLTQSVKEISQKANQEIQDLEKEVATAKEEVMMKEELMADLDKRMRHIQDENDSLQKQVLETTEEIQEKRRHVKEIEAKLNNTIKELAGKSEQLEQLAEAQTSQNVLIVELERKVSELTTDCESRQSRIQELEQSEEILMKKVSVQQSKVEECAKFEDDSKVLVKRIEVFEKDVARLTAELEAAQQHKSKISEEYEGVKVQVSAMEELTVSLTNEAKEKDSTIGSLRTSITEKDLEMAKTIREVDEGATKLRQSLIEEQNTAQELKIEIESLRQTLEETQQESKHSRAEAETKLTTLEEALKVERSNVAKESKAAETAMAKVHEIVQAQEIMIEKVKQEFQKEKQKNKFELELQYQTLIQNKENEVRQQFATVQTKDQEVVQNQQQEIQALKLELQKQKQARLMALMTLQGKITLLKREQEELVNVISKDLNWKRVGPKLNMITGLVEQVKLVSQGNAASRKFKQEVQEYKEQLVEYKGLTQQLQEEKKSLNQRLQENLGYVEQAKTQNSEIINSLNTQLQTTQTELAEAHQMLSQQKNIAEESLKLLNQQHVDQFQKLSEQNRMTVARLSEESDILRKQREEAQNDLLKYKTKTSEQQSLLMTSKETISNMVSNENQLMTELKRKITELGEKQEQYKARVLQTKQEKEAVTSKYETLKKENENLRELIKIKDGQIEEARGYEQDRRNERERLYNENRKMKDMLSQRENEIKEVVMTLKVFADEKKRLEKENERMRTKEMSVGHNNQAQKIQHHLRIKEENNQLKEENYNLIDQVRRLTATGGAQGAVNGSNTTFGNLASDSLNTGAPGSSPSNVDAEKNKKELGQMHEGIARLAENLLKLNGVGQFVSSNESLAAFFKKTVIPASAQQTSSASYYANQKLKGTIEVIMHICKQLHARNQECNQMSNEFKKMEAEIQKLQLERTHLLQGMGGVASQSQQMVASSQRTQSNTMQPSFQVATSAQAAQQRQQQQTLAQGQPNQYRRQSSRGAQGASQSQASAQSQGQNPGQANPGYKTTSMRRPLE